jgi:phenolic acid decarboxylase
VCTGRQQDWDVDYRWQNKVPIAAIATTAAPGPCSSRNVSLANAHLHGIIFTPRINKQHLKTKKTYHPSMYAHLNDNMHHTAATYPEVTRSILSFPKSSGFAKKAKKHNAEMPPTIQAAAIMVVCFGLLPHVPTK